MSINSSNYQTVSYLVEVKIALGVEPTPEVKRLLFKNAVGGFSVKMEQ